MRDQRNHQCHQNQIPPLAAKVITERRANDAAFLKDVITNPNCPEYNAYHTRWCRQSGTLPLPETDVKSFPLIDNPSADPDTKYYNCH